MTVRNGWYHTVQRNDVLRNTASYPEPVSSWDLCARQSRVLSCQIWRWGVWCSAGLQNSSPLTSLGLLLLCGKEICTTNGQVCRDGTHSLGSILFPSQCFIMEVLICAMKLKIVLLCNELSSGCSV